MPPSVCCLTQGLYIPLGVVPIAADIFQLYYFFAAAEVGGVGSLELSTLLQGKRLVFGLGVLLVVILLHLIDAVV